MLRWTVTFLIIAIIAAVFGFGPTGEQPARVHVGDAAVLRRAASPPQGEAAAASLREQAGNLRRGAGCVLAGTTGGTACGSIGCPAAGRTR